MNFNVFELMSMQELDTARETVQALPEVVTANNEDPTVCCVPSLDCAVVQLHGTMHFISPGLSACL